jgi:hypothetical protein
MNVREKAGLDSASESGGDCAWGSGIWREWCGRLRYTEHSLWHELVEFMILRVIQLHCFRNAVNLEQHASKLCLENRLSLRLPQARVKRRELSNVKSSVKLSMSEDLATLLLGNKSTYLVDCLEGWSRWFNTSDSSETMAIETWSMEVKSIPKTSFYGRRMIALSHSFVTR